MADLSQLVKAYDIRGIVPDQLNADLVRDVGAAFIHLTGADAVVVARDMRATSPELAAAFAGGAMEAGADVVDAGLGSTDYLYYCSGILDLPGAMLTASHNPAAYNGIKLCRAGAAPVGQDTGLSAIRGWLEDGLPTTTRPPGRVVQRNLLTDYAGYLRSLVDLTGMRPLRIVVDAGNGMAGYTVPAVLAGLPVEVVPLYFELDGTFPNHEANPIEPKNLVELQRAVNEVGADLGLAFDGDADRCFVVDEHGQPVSPSAIIGLVATRELSKHPGSRVVHNVITSLAATEVITEHGGVPIRSRVGHSFIKQVMAETGAIFGGEHSGHYYFRDFWRADTGMLAALHVLAAAAERNTPFSQLAAEFARYVASGELNSVVTDVPAMLDRVDAHFAGREGVDSDRLDGLTIRLPGKRWFNLRPSNTEPLLRLNVESPTHGEMESLRDEVLAIVRD